MAANRSLQRTVQLLRPASLQTVRCISTTSALCSQPLPPAGKPAPSPFKEKLGGNPYDKAAQLQGPLHDFGSYLTACMPKYIQQFSVYKDELTLYTAPQNIVPLMTFLRDHSNCRFTQISDIAGVDYPSRSKRFEIVYNLLSIVHNARIRVKTYADEVSPVPSIVPIFGGADWYEREIWDMYGVFFSGHPDLRRILTDYGFEGHPLRKDFPLTGYVEVRYDEEKKRVVQEPLQLSQAFRDLSNATSPWEQMHQKPDTYKLPKPEPEKKEEAKK